ncbi:YoaP domain-containing protein, partial [Thomasclavelia cocleata]
QPKFKIKQLKIEDRGFVLYYSHQCPFTAKYVDLLNRYCDENDIDIVIRYIDNKEMAQTSPTIFNTYSLFYEGKFITNEILSIKKFEKIVGTVK